MGLQCQTYYYGDECSVFCIPSVDCKGHYSCDERTGDKVCDQGWEGQDCTRPKVKEGSCNRKYRYFNCLYGTLFVFLGWCYSVFFDK